VFNGDESMTARTRAQSMKAPAQRTEPSHCHCSDVAWDELRNIATHVESFALTRASASVSKENKFVLSDNQLLLMKKDMTRSSVARILHVRSGAEGGQSEWSKQVGLSDCTQVSVSATATKIN